MHHASEWLGFASSPQPTGLDLTGLKDLSGLIRGGTLHVRKATRPEPQLLALYKALDLDPLPGGVQKTYV